MMTHRIVHTLRDAGVPVSTSKVTNGYLVKSQEHHVSLSPQGRVDADDTDHAILALHNAGYSLRLDPYAQIINVR